MSKYKIWTGGDQAVSIMVQNILCVNGYTWAFGVLEYLNKNSIYLYDSRSSLSFSDADRANFVLNGEAIEIPVAEMLSAPDFKAFLESL